MAKDIKRKEKNEELEKIKRMEDENNWRIPIEESNDDELRFSRDDDTPIEDFYMGWVTEANIKKIQTLIKKLDSGDFRYPDAAKQKERADALRWFLDLAQDPGENINSAIKRIEEQYPDFRAGRVNPAIPDLMKELEADDFVERPKWLYPEDVKEIEELITKLEKEYASSWPYPNKERKREKANCLKWLIDLNEDRSVRDINAAVKLIESRYPDFRAGTASTRVADLVEKLSAKVEPEPPRPINS